MFVGIEFELSELIRENWVDASALHSSVVSFSRQYKNVVFAVKKSPSSCAIKETVELRYKQSCHLKKTNLHFLFGLQDKALSQQLLQDIVVDVQCSWDLTLNATRI